MKYKQLEAYAKEQGYTREEFAEGVGLSYQALGKRINGQTEFELKEVRKIIEFLNLTLEQVRIYFNLFF